MYSTSSCWGSVRVGREGHVEEDLDWPACGPSRRTSRRPAEVIRSATSRAVIGVRGATFRFPARRIAEIGHHAVMSTPPTARRAASDHVSNSISGRSPASRLLWTRRRPARALSRDSRCGFRAPSEKLPPRSAHRPHLEVVADLLHQALVEFPEKTTRSCFGVGHGGLLHKVSSRRDPE